MSRSYHGEHCGCFGCQYAQTQFIAFCLAAVLIGGYAAGRWLGWWE